MVLVLALCVFVFISVFVSFKQISFLRSFMDKKPIILEQDDFLNAIKVGIENEKFSIFSNFYALVINLCFLLFGFAFLKDLLIKENTILEGTFFILSYLFITSILNLPTSYYKTFVKDKKQGFTNSSLGLFIKDSIKSLLLLFVFGFLLIYLLLLCFDLLGNAWWIGAFLVCFLFVLGANIIYPNFIIFWFNKLKPLEDESLKTSIDELLHKVGFKCDGVFIMDASKRDSRLNAFFAGLGSSKKVVLFDTLVDKMPKNELLAVLGHELGHFKHKDILKNIFFMAFIFFVMFFVFSFANDEILSLVSLDGFNAGVIMFLLIFSNIVLAPLMLLSSYISRKNEFAADKHGVDMSSKDDMKNALIILAKENKAFISSYKLKVLGYSHPPILDRINAIENL